MPTPATSRRDDPLPIFAPTPTANPRKLALGAWIHGAPRPPVDKIRVLELGAGSGTNLLPLAFYDPEGAYLGLDEDHESVTLARAAAAAMGLANVRFEVATGEPPAGPFDYVLVPDLFARAQGESRRAILSLCRAVLAPHGLLYLDYPVAPGGIQRALVAELMRPLLGVEEEGGTPPDAMQEKAKAFRSLIAKTEHPYPNLLAGELERAAQAPVLEMWRDYLSPPAEVPFHREVAEEAARHGLRYVYDAAFNQPEGHVPAGLREELARIGLKGDALEQGLDVFCNRPRRASVFCREDLAAVDPPGPEALDQLFIASSLAPVRDPPRLDPGFEESFAGPFGQRIGSADPLLKASLLVLGERYPGPLSFADLMGHAVGLLHRNGAEGVPNDEQVGGVAKDLWALYHQGLVDLHLAAPRVPPRASKKLHALARHEAETRTALTTPSHGLLSLQGFEAALVKRMAEGGTEDALVGALVTSIASGDVPLQLGGQRLTDPLLLEPMTRGLLQRAFATLGRWGLLEAEPG